MLTRAVPLNQIGDQYGRNEHQIIIDKIIDDWFSEGLDDTTVYYVEKDCYYTPQNVSPAECSNVGNPLTDIDIGKYDLEEDRLFLSEIKGSKDVPADMSYPERREYFDEIEKAHDQISRVVDAVERIEAGEDFSIETDHEVRVWADVFEDVEAKSESIPPYEGTHILTDNAYQLAQESDSFQTLTEGLFDQNYLFEGGGRIRER